MAIGFQLGAVAAGAGRLVSRLRRLLGGIRTAISRIPLTSASGRMTAMHTTRSPAEITSAADIFTLSDRTTWSYDQPTGLLTNAVSRTRLTGLGGAYSADGADGILTAEQHSVDARGNVTIARTVIDRGNKTVHQLTYTPGSAVAALATTVNGLLVSSRSASGLVTTYAYDALGRQVAVQDARGAVHSRGYDEHGRVAWESDPATNGTWYAYDALGRRTAVTNALGQVTHTAYDAEGRAIATWGATYPVAYEYDAAGRMTAMLTSRDSSLEISGYSSFILHPSSFDRTTWSYDQPTGLLTNKLSADGKGTAYTYTPDGKLATRAWARGVTTTYAYDAADALSTIAYSDDTPDVAFTYDRLGRMASAVSAVATNTYAYDALDLVSETQNGVLITRSTDSLGRPAGFSLGSDYAVQYAYDAYGRFQSLTSASSATSAVTFTYSYLPDSDLISGMTASSGFLWTRAYESARSLITSVENSFGETVISRYDYTNDELGRRTAISRSGQAFGEMPVRDTYGYNARSEVTSARRTLADTPSQEVRGFSYDYAYDPIGNRITSTEYDHEGNALESEYTANALNQYERRTVPGYAGVRGTATNTATVTVNGNPAWRLDEYFYGGDEADNSLAAVMKQLAITAVYNPPGTNTPDVVTSQTGRVFVAQTPEQFQYDEDGNLTQDGRFTYTWDAESRLIGVTTRADLPASVPRIRVEYAYDHQSRRIASATAVWTNGNWQATESRAFLYDGWNVVQETINHQPSTTNYYTWGLDLSGSIQGAGGIGGLLAATFGGTTSVSSVLYCYDANGNVGQLVSPDGALLAHYEYSPLGETIVSAGPLAKTNPFRFSTKHWDDLTGLGYWGYRYYHPEMGRWMSRDPLRDAAFLKQNYLGLVHYARTVGGRVAGTYTFCVNEPFARFDSFGLCDTRCEDSVITLSFSKSLYVGIGTLSMNYIATEDRHVCGIQCPDCSCGYKGHIETTHSGGMEGSWDVIALGIRVGEVGFSWSMGGTKVSDFNTCTGVKSTYGCNSLSVSISGGPCVRIPPVIKFCLICSIGIQGTLCEGQPEQWTTKGGCEVQACGWGVCAITPVWP